MKFLLFTDLQLKATYLDFQTKVLKKISSYVKEKDIDFLAFLGDGFDDRRNVNADMLKIYADFFNSVSKHLKNIFILVGNHDKPFDDSPYSYFTPFKNWNKIQVIEENVFAFQNIFFIPYFSENKTYEILKDIDVNEKIEYLFMHFGLNNVPLNNNHKVVSKISVSLLKNKFPNLKRIFSGHFHNKSKLKLYDVNVLYIGNPIALNFSETGEKGIYIFDNEKDKLIFIEFKEFPKYVTANYDDYDYKVFIEFKKFLKNNKNNFVRAIFKSSKEKLLLIPENEFDEYAKKIGVLDLKIIKMPKMSSNLIDFGEKFFETNESIVKAFLDFAKKEKMSKEELKYGLKKLKSIEG